MSMIINPYALGAGYSEVSYIGTDPAATPNSTFQLANDYKSVISVTVPSGGRWVKTFHMRMITTAAGDKIKPVLYSAVNDPAATLVLTGQELILPAISTDTDVSVNWNADGSASFIPAGTYGLGVISLANFCQSIGGSTYWNADTYSDGPANPFGSGIGLSGRTMICWCPSSVSGP